LVFDEVIVKFKDRVPFWQYILIRHKIFGLKLYKLCGGNGYVYDMAVYVGNQLLNAASHITPTQQTAVQLTRKLEGVGCKLLMDNYLLSHQLFSDLHNR